MTTNCLSRTILALLSCLSAAQPQASPGSLYVAEARLADLARDLRASRPGDLVTILVSDRASAQTRGATNSSRQSSADAGITSLFGPAKGVLKDLAALGGEQELQGQGETSRQSQFSTTLSARVLDVLPNGDLVVEGTKESWVNSERQIIYLRGIARWNDVSPTNVVRSDRLAGLQVRVNGKGVVGDAVRRPFFLYRLLLGLLPF